MTLASAFLFLEIIQQILLCPSGRRVYLRRSWLRHCGTSRKVAGFSPIGSLRFYIQLTLGSTHPYRRNEYQIYVCGGQCIGLLTLQISCAVNLEIVGFIASWNTTGLSKPVRGRLRLLFLLPNVSKKVTLRFRWWTVQLVCIPQWWKGSSKVSTLFYRKRQIEQTFLNRWASHHYTGILKYIYPRKYTTCEQVLPR